MINELIVKFHSFHLLHICEQSFLVIGYGEGLVKETSHRKVIRAVLNIILTLENISLYVRVSQRVVE